MKSFVKQSFSYVVARPKRFELLTPRFVVWCSIQLSYGRFARHTVIHRLLTRGLSYRLRALLASDGPPSWLGTRGPPLCYEGRPSPGKWGVGCVGRPPQRIRYTASTGRVPSAPEASSSRLFSPIDIGPV